MKAIFQTQFGGPETLEWGDVPRPTPKTHEVLIRVHATAFNPADVGARVGRNLQPGASPSILGLECAGVIEAVGEKAATWQVGDRVCALLTSGGYAEYVAVHKAMVFPIPDALTMQQAATLPESMCTVWSNLALTPEPLTPRDILIHGGSGSVGTVAIQMAKHRGDRVFTTTGSEEGIALVKSLGADHPINYRNERFEEVVLNVTDGTGVQQIFDIIGASYFDQNVDALSQDGHLAIIGVQGGTNLEVNLLELIKKRISITATMLKTREETGVHSKATVVAEVKQHFWDAVETGAIRPIVGAEYPLSVARLVHDQHSTQDLPHGKTVLTVDE